MRFLRLTACLLLTTAPAAAQYGPLTNAPASNAALQAVPVTGVAVGMTITRLGFFTQGDGGRMVYTLSGSNCSSADNGAQVQSSTGTGCWTAVLPPTGVTPQVWGAVGNGTTDDHLQVQAAITASATAGIPLLFDSVHLYNLNGNTLTIASPLKIIGPFRYGQGVVNRPSGGTPRKCPGGLVNLGPGATMINAPAITGVMDGLCLDATGNDATQASTGAAIKLAPPSSTTYQSGWRVENN